jgi:hypothetical protein
MKKMMYETIVTARKRTPAHNSRLIKYLYIRAALRVSGRG